MAQDGLRKSATGRIDALNAEYVKQLDKQLLDKLSDDLSPLIWFMNLPKKVKEELASCSADLIYHMSKQSLDPKWLARIGPERIKQLAGLSQDLIWHLSGDSVPWQWLTKIRDGDIAALQAISTLPHWLVNVDMLPSDLGVLSRALDTCLDPLGFMKQYTQVRSHVNWQMQMQDAFSRGQMQSKHWLIQQLLALGLQCGHVFVLAGWIGTLSWLLDENADALGIVDIRSFDCDPFCAGIAETFNKKAMVDSWRFKAATIDVNLLRYEGYYFTTKQDGSTCKLPAKADTVINTSCDHMGTQDTWFSQIPPGTLTILQNNDWHENDTHNNCCDNLDEFAASYPMSEMLYAGQLDCTLYTRFMLIGRR